VDPKAAFEYARQHLNDDRSPYSTTAYSQWANADPEGAWAWLEKMPESQDKANARSHLISKFAFTDPQRAIREAATVAEQRRPDVMHGIASAWSSKDAGATLAWAQTLPERERYAAVGGVIDRLARTDVVEATKWIEQQTDRKIYDFAAGRFARTVVDDDPEGAMAWVKTIATEDSRNSSMGEIVRRWKKNDPAGFDAWQAKGNTVPEHLLK
jgi:hypothetical protein